MAERKDKQKVIGEPMTDEQIKVFLDFPPEDGENPDFHVLLKAYRALRVEDFERFVAFSRNRAATSAPPIPRGAPCWISCAATARANRSSPSWSGPAPDPGRGHHGLL